MDAEFDLRFGKSKIPFERYLCILSVSDMFVSQDSFLTILYGAYVQEK